MAYRVISGRYESGTEEQKQMYISLFGEENIQYKFDLYFHWYNIVHEVGHCILDSKGIEMSEVDEEMYVNQIAVSYWRYIGSQNRINELKSILQSIINHIPSPIPTDKTLTEFYRSIWNTEQINNVMIYGYFQLSSVLESIGTEKNFADVMSKIGIDIDKGVTLEKSDEEINSDNANIVLEKVMRNFRKLNIILPEIKVELVDNPMIQCAEKG